MFFKRQLARQQNGLVVSIYRSVTLHEKRKKVITKLLEWSCQYTVLESESCCVLPTPRFWSFALLPQSNAENLENPFRSTLFQSTNKMEPMEQNCQRRQATHKASFLDPVPSMNNPLPAGITFVSITLFFIYFNRWILKMVYVPVPKQTLRGYTCRNDIGLLVVEAHLAFCTPHSHSL